MKTRHLSFFVICSALIACNGGKLTEMQLGSIRQEVINHDLAFSKLSSEVGFSKALAEYAADDAIKLNPRAYATFGKTRLQEEAANDSIGNKQGTLTWKPHRVTVSDAGDMAAAFGDWFFTFKSPATQVDTTVHGNYLTVWKKQEDGSWRYILDGGNPTPGPTPQELLDLVK